MKDDRGVENGMPELIDLLGGRLEFMARMGASDSDTVLFRSQFDAGKSVPLHCHIDPEAFCVLSGHIEVFLDDDVPGWRGVETGHSLLVADGLKHSLRNLTDQPADLILAVNGRLARFFQEAGRPATRGEGSEPPTPEDVQRFVRVSALYGYWLASPAESAALTGWP